jgi:phenylacetic acid degradation operon negative regulatory protein
VSAISDAPRALTARSVVASTLLGVDPPRLSTLALVRSGELFGLSEGATRTALSRMVAAGDIEPEGDGYRLAGELLERHVRQQAARAPAARAWDGTWVLALVAAERRPAAERARLRQAMRRLRFAEVREGCWARPDDLDRDRSPAERSVIRAQCTLVRGARPEDVALFVAAFEPEAWAATAHELSAAMTAGLPALEAEDVGFLAEAFVLDAAVVRHLLADPLLPAELAPAGWPAGELREVFTRFDLAFKATWRSWYRQFRSN